MSKRKPRQRFDVPDEPITDGPSLHFGAVDIPNRADNKVTSIYRDLSSVRPDPTQPRNLAPTAARVGWSGEPADIPQVLKRWQDYIESRLGRAVPVADLIAGDQDTEFDATVPDPANPNNRVPDPVAVNYLEVIRLAGSIHRIEQRKPSLVYKIGDNRYQIEDGERRYWACWFAHVYAGDPARVLTRLVPGRSRWSQAEANTTDVDLTAVGLARQLSLLVMTMYEETDDVAFTPYHELLTAEGSDRDFYAQVADGRKWKIKDGYLDRILAGLDLPSSRALSAYRKILTLPHDLWIQADEESWTEFRIRAALDEINNTNSSGKNTPESEGSLPTGKHDDDTTPSQGSLGTLQQWDRAIYDPAPGGHPAPRYAVGERVWIKTRNEWGRVLKHDDGLGYHVERVDGYRSYLSEVELAPAPPVAPSAPATPAPPTVTTNGWQVGDRCTVAYHGPGTVTHIVTRVGVVVKIDDRPHPVRVHERDLTPLDEPVRGQRQEGSAASLPKSPPPARAEDPAALTDEEFEGQPQRTPTPAREKRIIALDDTDAALINRLLVYSEGYLPAPHDMLGMILDAQDVLPGTYRDALDALGALEYSIQRDLERLNAIINMAYGFKEIDE